MSADSHGDWIDAYVEGRNRTAAVLMGVRRRGDRTKACRKVLVAEAATFAGRAQAAIGAPSQEHALALAGIAGAAWATRDALSVNDFQPEHTADERFREWMARGSASGVGRMVPELMAAADGDAGPSLPNLVRAQLDAPGVRVDADTLTQPAYDVERAASSLARLSWTARPRSEDVHRVRAEGLDAQLAASWGWEHSYIRAHASAVRELTGLHGAGREELAQAMLAFIATHPPHERATLQASKVATLLADALGPRARMEILDALLLTLFDAASRGIALLSRARDLALVLLLLDADDDADDDDDAGGAAADSAQDAERAAAPPRTDHVAENAAATAQASAAAGVDRETRYMRAADAGAISEAVAVVLEAVGAEDVDQASVLLRDLAGRVPESAAPLVLVDPALESDEDGDEAFTVLTPAPAAAAAALARVSDRLLLVDDRGTEHPDDDAADGDDVYTPNYVHDIAWCDRAAQVVVDSKGELAPAMRHTMVAILVEALRQDGVPALLTGRVPELEEALVVWDGAA